MGIAAGVVAGRADGLFEPGDGLLPLVLLDQVSPNIVVGIAEVGINLDGLQAFRDGALVVAEEGVGPAAESVGFGRGAGFDRLRVEGDGLVVLALYLTFVGLLEILFGQLAQIVV